MTKWKRENTTSKTNDWGTRAPLKIVGWNQMVRESKQLLAILFGLLTPEDLYIIGYSVWFTYSRRHILFGFPIFLLLAYLMTVLQATRRPRSVKYLRSYFLALYCWYTNHCSFKSIILWVVLFWEQYIHTFISFMILILAFVRLWDTF